MRDKAFWGQPRMKVIDDNEGTNTGINDTYLLYKCFESH